MSIVASLTLIETVTIDAPNVVAVGADVIQSVTVDSTRDIAVLVPSVSVVEAPISSIVVVPNDIIQAVTVGPIDSTIAIMAYRTDTGAFTFRDVDFHVGHTVAGQTANLPDATSEAIKDNQIFVYSNESDGLTTLQTTNAQVINIPGSEVTSIVVYPGESLTVQKRPSTGWKLI